jgi:hypothetical protein
MIKFIPGRDARICHGNVTVVRESHLPNKEWSFYALFQHLRDREPEMAPMALRTKAIYLWAHPEEWVEF